MEKGIRNGAKKGSIEKVGGGGGGSALRGDSNGEGGVDGGGGGKTKRGIRERKAREWGWRGGSSRMSREEGQRQEKQMDHGIKEGEETRMITERRKRDLMGSRIKTIMCSYQKTKSFVAFKCLFSSFFDFYYSNAFNKQDEHFSGNINTV